jgi:hypothetical protein
MAGLNFGCVYESVLFYGAKIGNYLHYIVHSVSSCTAVKTVHIMYG